MNWKLPAAVLSVILAVALIIPAVNTLSPGLDGLATDLKNGNFSFLNPPPPADATLPPDFDPSQFGDLSGIAKDFGGLTGKSDGGFIPTPTGLPETWNMDRDGAASDVTIDYVFNPALGAMKRLKAYDQVDGDYTLGVADESLRPVLLARAPPSTHTQQFVGRFPIYLSPDEATPIYSVAPDAAITSYTTDREGLSLAFFRDGADTYYVKPQGNFRGTANLTVTMFANPRYYTPTVASGLTLDAYQGSLPVAKPDFPPGLQDPARIVLDEMGLRGERNVKRLLDTMAAYFNAFGEGDIPNEREQRDPYLAIALGKNGCCRHRAFAFLVTAQSLGIPTRLVANEAHAYAEVYIPPSAGNPGGWTQWNLGGCGNYTVNNPRGIQREYSPNAEDPTSDAPATRPTPPNAASTVIDISSYPEDIEKGTPFTVKGTVKTATSNQPLAGVKVDLFLNETKLAPGYLAGRGTTDQNGVWTIVGEVPREAPAKGYQLVAHAQELRTATFLYRESWSDPEVRVRSNTTLKLDLPTVDGRAVEVLVKGSLTDSKGKGVQGATVRIEVDGAQMSNAITDSQGGFRVPIVFDNARQYSVRASFAGDGYNRPSADQRVITISDVSVSIPVSLTLVRGESTIVEGTLSTRTGPLTGRSGNVVLPAGFMGTAGETLVPFVTDGSGRFSVKLAPAKDAELRVYDVEYRFSNLNPKRQAVEVAMRPQILPAIPKEMREGDALEVRAVLLDDRGSPMAREPIRLTIPGTDVDLSGTTVQDGTVTFRVDPAALEAGTFAPTLTYPGGSRTVTTEAKTTLKVRSAGAGLLADLWPWLLGGVLLAGLAVGAVLAGNRELRKRLAAAAARVGRSPIQVRITHPNLPAHLPPVAGPGEPVGFRVTATLRRKDQEEPLAGARIEVSVDGTRLELTTDAQGVAEFMYTFPREDDYAVALRVTPAARGVKPLTHVHPHRAVNYRHQIEVQYLDLLKRVRELGVPVAPGITPRDLERALLDSGADSRALAALAGIFEVSDYSERPITRVEWLAFSEAGSAALQILSARAASAAAPPLAEVRS